MKHAKESLTTLTCFKAYDVRGELGINFDIEIAAGRMLAATAEAYAIADAEQQ